jgi:UDP-N-acetylglucosamine 4,6-dehydratase
MTTYLITGAAGSLGAILVKNLSADENNIIRAFDIDEYGLSALPKGDNIRKILGSVANGQQVTRAAHGVDVVIHCAAMKNLDISEYNVQPLIETNVTGTYNVAMACQVCLVKTAVFISSDKATSGLSTYGATKLLGERIWQWAHRTSPGARFVTLRSGNFCESRGNVFEVWCRQIRANEIPTITDPEMRRYFIKTEKVACLVIKILRDNINCPSGTVIVPKMKEHKIIDIFRKYWPDYEYRIVGSREGETLREELLCKLDNVIAEFPDVVVVRP